MLQAGVQHYKIRAFYIAAAFCSMLFTKQNVQAQAVKLAHLTCEYLINPFGIDAANPRLSWQMEDERQGAK